MPKKKSFVNKKTAVTYKLFARDTQDGDEGPSISFARTDRHYDKEGPLDETVYDPDDEYEEEEFVDTSAAEQREMAELGLKLDGYNYLQHLRTIGGGTSSTASNVADAAGGSRAFIATQNLAPQLKADVVAYDAYYAQPKQEVEEDEEEGEETKSELDE